MKIVWRWLAVVLVGLPLSYFLGNVLFNMLVVQTGIFRALYVVGPSFGSISATTLLWMARAVAIAIIIEEFWPKLIRLHEGEAAQ
jgi:hypothetical protein